MAQIQNQKILRLDNKNKTREAPEFITEDVVENTRQFVGSHKLLFDGSLELLFVWESQSQFFSFSCVCV